MNRRLLPILVLTIGFHSLSAFASRTLVETSNEAPLVRSREVESDELRAFARAEDRQTLSEMLEASRPARLNLDKLMQLTHRAQTLWLAGNTAEARQTFKSVAELFLEDDWREPQRDAIAYAYLRLSQSAPTMAEQRDWIEKVAAVFPKYRPSADAFPPPLISVLEEAKSLAKKNAVEISLGENWSDYRFLLVNGRKHELSKHKKLSVPPGVLRITALSDAKPPLTEKLTATDLQKFRILSSWIAEGSCESPRLSEVNGIAVEGVYANHCTSKRDQRSLSLQPMPMLPKEVAWPVTPPSEPPTTVSKKTWWFIGGAAVLTGIAITAKVLSEKKVEPTSRQGF